MNARRLMRVMWTLLLLVSSAIASVAQEKPRLIKVWLRREHLVEILYGKHIVLIIESAPSGHHQPVGIELCRSLVGHKHGYHYKDYEMLHE